MTQISARISRGWGKTASAPWHWPDCGNGLPSSTRRVRELRVGDGRGARRPVRPSGGRKTPDYAAEPLDRDRTNLFGLGFRIHVDARFGSGEENLKGEDPSGVARHGDHGDHTTTQPGCGGVGIVIAHDHRWPTPVCFARSYHGSFPARVPLPTLGRGSSAWGSARRTGRVP